MSGNFLKTSRITILLLLLAAVALGEWLTKERSTNWDDSLWVAIYPINGDDSKASADFIGNLSKDDFDDIEKFMQEEAESFGLTLDKPVVMNLAPEIKTYPPTPPPNGNIFSVMLWSLKMRYWAWSVDNYDSPKDIQIFVLYFDPETNKRLAHSIGLQKGLLGVVNAFSSEDMAGENNFVIAHEMLHTLGATDKYDIASNMPAYPDGYADPDQEPLYPQNLAEIMGGTIPLSDSASEMPEGLNETIIGETTAAEIRWLHDDS